MKARHRLLEEGPCKTATSMIYISPSNHFPKVVIYQSDCVLGKENYQDFSEITVYLLKTNTNTNLCGPDISVRVGA